MNLAIVLCGLVLLAGLAAVIGTADTYARDAAWRRIGTARRDQQERDRAVRRCLASPRCPHCPIDRHFGG